MEGRFTEDITAMSGDNKVKLYIPRNTIGKNRAGSILSSIRIKEEGDPPVPPSHSKVISLIYDIGPGGATFDPPIDLIIKYDESEIPEGVAEKNLVVAWWDKTAGEWIELESTVDPETHTITTKVSHFSVFTVMARTSPASFNVADLSVTPGEVEPGENVIISAIVTNTGDLTGSYEATMKIDDIVAQTKEVTLDGGGSETISFSITPNTAGEYSVNINGLLGTYTVKVPKVPASFTVSTFTISPDEVNIGESVAISATITNTGELLGTCEVCLKINNVVAQTKILELAGGSNQKVAFTIVKHILGDYTVDVNGISGLFVVREEAPPVKEEVAAASVPAPAPKLEPAPALEPTPTPGLSWGLIGGIIAGVVVVGLTSYLLVRKRKKSKYSV
ncbi:CARDB domain-containing protein [Chloroflexota bacterium]